MVVYDRGAVRVSPFPPDVLCHEAASRNARAVLVSSEYEGDVSFPLTEMVGHDVELWERGPSGVVVHVGIQVHQANDGD